MAITFFKKKQPTITNIQNEILHNTTISTNIASIIAEYAHEYSYSHKLASYPQLISIMTLLSDGKMAVSASDGIIRILDIITGKCYCKLAGHVNNLSFYKLPAIIVKVRHLHNR